ncbi:MAG: cytochrome c-type biogenesis protein [Gammaproteobacteria bacterium]
MNVRLSLLGLALLCGAACAAVEPPLEFADPLQAQRYDHLIQELRCLVCQNQSLADSNAELAGDLRREVQRMIASGQDDRQIAEFLVSRYGDFVLYRPPFKALTLLLWLGPAVLLLAGGWAALRIVRRRSRAVAPELSVAERRLAAELLRATPPGEQRP